MPTPDITTRPAWAPTCSWSEPVAPSPAVGRATTALKGKQSELTTLLQRERAPDRDRAIEALFDSVIDYDALAKNSLGPYWDERSDDERKGFRDAMVRLIRNAALKNAEKTLDYRVTYKGESAEANGIVLVHTVATNLRKPDQDPASIDYAMHQANGNWLAFDIVTAGSSLVSNYRSQFDRVIKKRGFSELLTRMQKKADKEGA